MDIITYITIYLFIYKKITGFLNIFVLYYIALFNFATTIIIITYLYFENAKLTAR